jgi:hypothetical protein
LMILQTILQLYGSLTHSLGNPCPQLDIRIGNYCVPHDVGDTVKILVVVVQIGNTKKLLDAFKTKVGMLPVGNTQGDFLRSQTQILVHNLQRMARKLRCPDILIDRWCS